jgi:hypothetical protein
MYDMILWTIVFFTIPTACVIKFISIHAKDFEEKQARTKDKREALIHSRLAEEFRKEGHKDPTRAALDHTSISIHVEHFRRFACRSYVERDMTLSDIKQEWLKESLKAIHEVIVITQGRLAATKFTNQLKITIMDTPADDVFIYGDAAKKHKEQSAKRKANLERYLSDPTRCEVADHVMDQFWNNLRNSKRLAG